MLVDYYESDMLRFSEVRGDLLTASDDYVIAHCISRDCALGKGVARTLDVAFGVKSLLLQKGFNRSDEKVAIVDVPPHGLRKRKVANMVTKDVYRMKPTYESLRAALVALQEEMAKEGLTKLAMPRIGCGLDCLRWPVVRGIILDVFNHPQTKDDRPLEKVDIRIYTL